MIKNQISEKVVAGLPVPAKGNKVHFFSGATLQGKKAPAGFWREVHGGRDQIIRIFPQGGRPQISQPWATETTSGRRPSRWQSHCQSQR